MEPDPFSALLDTIAELKEVASKLHADLVRGDKAMTLLAELVEAENRLDHTNRRLHEYDYAFERARQFLAAAPNAIPPGDGDA